MKSITVTSAGDSAATDRRYRMRFYFIAMSTRIACVASLFWVRGPWLILPVLGAVFLPYFAVMIGNAVAHHPDNALENVPNIALESAEPNDATPQPTLIVVDAQADRQQTKPPLELGSQDAV